MADDTNVTDESLTSGQANPMDEAPAEPTEAQQEQGADASDDVRNDLLVADPAASLPGADAAAEQRAKDDAWRAEHPNEVLFREANPDVGGESFDRYATKD